MHGSRAERDARGFLARPLSGMQTPCIVSAGPPGPAEILPGTAVNVALGIQSLRTRVFRGVELKDHPLRIRNARIGRRVQKPDFFVRESQVYRTDVIFQLLGFPGSDDHAADSRPS